MISSSYFISILSFQNSHYLYIELPELILYFFIPSIIFTIVCLPYFLRASFNFIFQLYQCLWVRSTIFYTLQFIILIFINLILIAFTCSLNIPYFNIIISLWMMQSFYFYFNQTSCILFLTCFCVCVCV